MQGIGTDPLTSMRLTKQQRLATPADYRRVYQSNYWGNTRLFSFNALPKDGVSQIGVTVSKKVSKSAVVRNRIKRQIKEFYRHQQSQLAKTQLVITAKPSCFSASDDERRESLEELWEKVLRWRRWYERSERKQTSSRDHSGDA